MRARSGHLVGSPATEMKKVEAPGGRGLRPTPRVPRRHSRRLESPKAHRRKSRSDRSVRHGAVPLAIHRPAPRLRRRSPIRMPETLRTRRTILDHHHARDFGDNPMTRSRNVTPRKGAIPERPPPPAGGGGLAVADLSLGSGSGPKLAGVFLRESRKTPSGSVRIQRARRPFPGRKGVSAVRAGRP